MHHKITMIDDNSLDHLIVKRICNSEGLFKEMAHLDNAQKIVECFTATENDFAHVPDILLLDLNMPDVSGWDVLESLKVNYQNVGRQVDVHILSGSLDLLDQERSLQYPFVKNFLIKPMTRLKLRNLYATYCN